MFLYVKLRTFDRSKHYMGTRCACWVTGWRPLKIRFCEYSFVWKHSPNLHTICNVRSHVECVYYSIIYDFQAFSQFHWRPTLLQMCFSDRILRCSLSGVPNEWIFCVDFICLKSVYNCVQCTPDDASCEHTRRNTVKLPRITPHAKPLIWPSFVICCVLANLVGPNMCLCCQTNVCSHAKDYAIRYRIRWTGSTRKSLSAFRAPFCH